MKTFKGFTLVELIVTITIIIILSSISVPIHKDYVNRSKLAEGYTLLATIRSAQESYFSEHGSFFDWRQSGHDWTNNDDVLNVNARTNKYFKEFLSGWDIPHAGNYSFTVWTRVPSDLKYYGSYLKLYYNLTSGTTFEQNDD